MSQEPKHVRRGLPTLPSLVIGTVSHTRRTPLRHAFTNRQYQWLVDVDDLPRHGWPLRALTRIEARDHLDGGRLGGGIRGDVERFLARRGVTLEAGDRVVMLANARVLGHVFDPLTVFWCLAPDGGLRACIFEVHNTYGERHAYLLDVDTAGRARTDKAFYVSPFNDTSGEYAVSLTLGPDRVAVTVGLDRDGERVLTATTTGVPLPATDAAVVRTATRHLLMTWRVSALIRAHGIRLWARRLPIQPRRPHSQEYVR
ncbi:DUF1365 domain-containing protein [Janibacter cremeus]|uniref:DUF1365 domain-containing protein n=1 Tax=Janibacter cremeus TaxID=1285192 RepID=UPI0023F68067|nr:DUF1365 domain-containing protein [Janibacter cremeus]WEV76916.1 DUF1365 domain-containing protein [Janibacter cremeus]